ncbi:MAG: hypothetical protein R3293_01665 [Candidatus Promineifilaceae bacterium]|nr:hypothetical protein [Candidatus Promineifilaceae bacterium]
MAEPQRIIRKVLVFLPLLVLVLSGCFSLAPEFSYQGRLLGDDGRPVPDGNYEMTYSIYHVSAGGTEVYSDTQTIPIKDGLFTTSIGPSEELDPELFAQPTWMEVTVEGETLSPRQKLQGSPFAFSLVSGAVIQGEEPLERTFGGFDDTGAVLTIWNQDSTDGGGHSLFALNQAAPSGDNRSITSALLAIASGGINDAVTQTGAYGAIIRSEHFRGMYTKGAPAYYAAVFDSDVGIQLTGGGSCSGCSIAYMAYNIGTETIAPGDFVKINGVELDQELNVPVMQVEKANPGDSSVIGVAAGAVRREPISQLFGAQVGGFEQTGGPAQINNYVSIIVQGLVQARVRDAASLELGQNLESLENLSPAVGRIMSAPDKDGLSWIMLGG